MKHMTSFVLLLIFILMIPKVSSADFNYEIQRMRQKLNEPSDSHWAFRGKDYGPAVLLREIFVL